MIVEPLFPELVKENLETMDGLVFEDLCLKLFQHMYSEYIVQKTNVNDFGADILIHFDYDRKMVIQCKTANGGKPVGLKAVQEALASKNFYDAQFACVVTNTTFTPAATELAERSNVTLIDLDGLLKQFSRTTFTVEDIPFLYERYVEAFRSAYSIYLDKFRTDPRSIIEISRLEVLQLTKLCVGEHLPTNFIDMEDNLVQGIHHIIYLAATTYRR